MQEHPDQQAATWKQTAHAPHSFDPAQLEASCRTELEHLKTQKKEVSKNLPKIIKKLEDAYQVVSKASGDAYEWSSDVFEGLQNARSAQTLATQTDGILEECNKELDTLGPLSAPARELLLDQVTERLADADTLIDKATALKASAESTNTDIPEKFRED